MLKGPIVLSLGAIVLGGKIVSLDSSQARPTGGLRAQEHGWFDKNRLALQAHNERIDKRGPLLMTG